MSRRHRAREMALQMLYQGDLGGTAPAEVFEDFVPEEYARRGAAARLAGGDEDDEEAKILEHARTLVDGTIGHLEEVDTLITSQADNWRLERMPGVDRNILRLAVFEFLYQSDVPKLVVIDEAIELAKRYGSENSSSFVNGLLDGLLKKHSFPGSVT
jgi:N utilization substance protein B